MLVDCYGRLDRGLQVAHVVHGIKDAKHVHAVGSATFDKFFDDIVGVMAVTKRILTPQQHLHGRIGHGFLKLAQALPGVFAKVADTGVEGCSTPGFQRPEANLVELCRDRQHVFNTHARCQ